MADLRSVPREVDNIMSSGVIGQGVATVTAGVLIAALSYLAIRHPRIFIDKCIEALSPFSHHPDARQRQMRGARLALMFGMLLGAVLIAIGVTTVVVGVRG